MTQSAVSLPLTPSALSVKRRGRWPVLVALSLWFALSFTLGARGAFINRPGTPPLALLAAVVIPIGLFLVLYRTSRSFYDFVLTADVALLTATQSWRFAGVGFIALNLLGFLPGYFAWPAGLGDMAIGITAPWVALALARDFANRRIFIAWNLFGIFDFAVLAVGMGAIAPLIFPNLLHTVTPQMVTAAPMRHLPLSLVPSFLVPMFTIFHLIALFQTGRAGAAKSI